MPQTIHAAVLGATGAQLSYLRALATVHRVKYVEEADLASARERVYSLLVISGAGWPAHVESLIALRPQLRWPALVTGHGDSSPSPLTLCHADAVCCPTPDARAIDTLALRSSQLLISDEDMRARWMQHEIIPAVSSRLHVSHAVAEVVVRHGYLGQSQGEIAAEMGITRRTVQRHQQYAVGVMGVETLKLVWLRASGRSHRDTLR